MPGRVLPWAVAAVAAAAAAGPSAVVEIQSQVDLAGEQVAVDVELRMEMGLAEGVVAERFGQQEEVVSHMEAGHSVGESEQ